MNARRARQRTEDGAIAVLTGILTIVLCVISAFSVDLGLAYSSRMQLRTAADAGALAAAGVYARVPTVSDCATAKAANYAAANAAAQSVAAANYADTGIEASTIDNIVVTCEDGGIKVALAVTADTDTFFGRLVPGTGDSLTSTAHAAALVDVPPAASGLRPLALCSSNLPTGTPAGVFKVDGPGTGNTAPPAIDLTDSDGGGVSDATEQLIPGNLWKKNPATNKNDDFPALDDDSDGLTRAQESAKGTDPLDSDTDNDGLLDGVDPDPRVVATNCPELADPGNWWTVQCPNNTGNKDLAAAVATGCDDPIKIVEGQGTKTGAALSSHLIDNCDTETLPANCLEADTGQINGNPVLSAFKSLIDKQTPFILPVFCGPPSPCDPVAIRGAENGTGKAGSNTDYPIYRMVGVTLCAYNFNNTSYENGCDSWDEGHGHNYLALQIHTVLVSGVTGKSECVLGAACDGGLRRVSLVE